MKLFDFYEPVPTLMQGEFPLQGWKSSDNQNLLLLWRQGEKTPVDQLVDEDCKMSEENIKLFNLPDGIFKIYTENLNGKGRIYAQCEVKSGTWLKTTLLSK